MKYLSAYTLLVLSGKTDPSAADITNLLLEVGITADAEQVKRVVDALKGKKLEDVIAEGAKKTQKLSGGSQAPAQVAVAAPVKVAPKVVAKVEEKVEDDFEGAGSLFD